MLLLPVSYASHVALVLSCRSNSVSVEYNAWSKRNARGVYFLANLLSYREEHHSVRVYFTALCSGFIHINTRTHLERSEGINDVNIKLNNCLRERGSLLSDD